jgi:hypothetical protein
MADGVFESRVAESLTSLLVQFTTVQWCGDTDSIPLNVTLRGNEATFLALRKNNFTR